MGFSILYNLDIFKMPIFFFVEKRKKISTFIGVLFSIGVYIFLIISLLKSDVFEKKSPFIVDQSLQTSKADPIRFNSKNLLAFTVADAKKKNFFDPTIFKLQIEHFVIKNDESGTAQIISIDRKQIKKCEEEDFAFNPSLFFKMGMKDSICLVNKSFEISGFWDESETK